MDWLREADDALTKKRRQEDAQRDAQRLEAQNFKAQADKISGMVYRLLNDLGVFWYGSSWFKSTFVIQIRPVGSWKLGTPRDLIDYGGPDLHNYTSVDLLLAPTPHFNICKHEYSNRDGPERTQVGTTINTSEAELQRALREIATDLPRYSIRKR
jgi:hypothetical protein